MTIRCLRQISEGKRFGTFRYNCMLVRQSWILEVIPPGPSKYDGVMFVNNLGKYKIYKCFMSFSFHLLSLSVLYHHFFLLLSHFSLPVFIRITQATETLHVGMCCFSHG